MIKVYTGYITMYDVWVGYHFALVKAFDRPADAFVFVVFVCVVFLRVCVPPG